MLLPPLCLITVISCVRFWPIPPFLHSKWSKTQLLDFQLEQRKDSTSLLFWLTDVGYQWNTEFIWKSYYCLNGLTPSFITDVLLLHSPSHWCHPPNSSSHTWLSFFFFYLAFSSVAFSSLLLTHFSYCILFCYWFYSVSKLPSYYYVSDFIILVVVGLFF